MTILDSLDPDKQLARYNKKRKKLAMLKKKRGSIRNYGIGGSKTVLLGMNHQLKNIRLRYK
jgi:hypothetical protein